jgi:putative Mg2+ transporter-C (MgtC) family protein
MQGVLHDVISHLESPEVLSGTMTKLILSAVLGGAIGLERELNHKPAGLRTNMFICFGCAMFTIVSLNLIDPSVADRTRIASNIIPGIGFIGAGSILHQRSSVQGLTTAATLFVVASIGMATGGGLYLQATFATIFILFALQVLGWVERRYSLKPLYMTYDASGQSGDEMVAELNRLLEERHHVLEAVEVSRSNGRFLVHFSVNLTHREHLELVDALKKNTKFTRIAFMGERE